MKRRRPTLAPIEKAPTGVTGLDEITQGGLPRGRTTLVTGGPGCGKTLLATQFIVNGILQYDEPGVFLAFEETADELATNMASLGVDLLDLVRQKKLLIDYIHLDPSEIEHTGAFDLEPLFVRIESAIGEIGAKRIALDTIEVLFAGLPDQLIIRSEVRRLFRWLKNKNMTSIATGERAERGLTRHNMEEFVSDCVILLEHRVQVEISTRHLQVLKYRGSTHGTNSYPFLIDTEGIRVTPITSIELDHEVLTEHVSTGIERLDDMLSSKGLYRGSSTLISGAAGTGKTSLVAHFVDAACRRNERALIFAFEESQSQIVRNMLSIGIDLDQWVKRGLLRFFAIRPTSFGLEMHLTQMHKLIDEWKPSVVAVDPVSNLLTIGTPSEANSMIRRLVDYLKGLNITAVLTDLNNDPSHIAKTEIGVSSLMDTWFLIEHIIHNGERNRGLTILKSRGTAHSNQIRELIMTGQGIKLADVYLGPDGVLTGSAKIAEQRRTEREIRERLHEADRRREVLEKKRIALESQIAAMRAEFEAHVLDLVHSMARDESAAEVTANLKQMAQIRSGNVEQENHKKGGRQK